MSDVVTKPKFIVEQEFFAHVERSIDESGVHPFPGIAIKQDGGIEFAAITDAGLCFQWFKKHLIDLDCAEVIVGIDRTTREGQGTEFDDVLTCFHWQREHQDVLRVGVINYQFEPFIVRPFDWNNEFWRKRVLDEVNTYGTPFGIVLELQ